MSLILFIVSVTRYYHIIHHYSSESCYINPLPLSHIPLPFFFLSTSSSPFLLVLSIELDQFNMLLKPKLILLALAAESTFARLQGHHRRNALNIHEIKRGLIDVNGEAGTDPLTATVGVDIAEATGLPSNPHPHGGPPHDGPHDGPHPHGSPHGHPHGHGHGDHPHPHGHDHGHHPHPHDNHDAFPVKPTSNWDQIPPDNNFSTEGFGERTDAHGDSVGYVGNVGDPWGSNIITVKAPDAHKYKYMAQFHGSKNGESQPWKVVIWNKIGPDGKMDGWFGHSALSFTLHPNEIVYVAFDENSQGGWSASPGDKLPTDKWGSYSSTWGEFDFGDMKNKGLTGFDVSCIQAQNAKQEVQGMSICLSDMSQCSSITSGAAKVDRAYTAGEAGVDGLAPTVGTGPVRFIVRVDYEG